MGVDAGSALHYISISNPRLRTFSVSPFMRRQRVPDFGNQSSISDRTRVCD